MAGSADANLLIAFAHEDDALHARARSHVAQVGRLRASVPATLEAFVVQRRHGRPQQELLARLSQHFDLDEEATLWVAARALDESLVATPFDAYHLADAHVGRSHLHTSDQRLLRTEFPTVPF